MESLTAKAIALETQPVALLWADEAPAGAIRFKPGRWGCVVNLFAAAATRGRAIGESMKVSGGGRMVDDFLYGERYIKDPESTRPAWVLRAACSWWSTHGVARTFGLFPFVLPKPTSARSTRQNDERSIRFQQG